MIARRIISKCIRSRTLHLGAVGFVSLLLISACSMCGADDSATPPSNEALSEPDITTSDRDHWAFRPLQQVEPPVVRDGAWPQNAVDRFILAKLEAINLRPMRPADRLTF